MPGSSIDEQLGMLQGSVILEMMKCMGSKSNFHGCAGVDERIFAARLDQMDRTAISRILCGNQPDGMEWPM